MNMALVVTGARRRLKARGRSNGLPTVLMGYAIECLVEAYALIGGGGRLTTARPDSDVDHRDFIVDEIGGYLTIYLQVKGTPALDRQQVKILVHFPKGKVPSDPRLIYVFCLLDPKALTLSHVWVIPAPEFNRLAPRSKLPHNRVELEFQAEIDPTQLGARLIELIKKEGERRPAERRRVRKAA
jgi:hypothetical protein